MWCINGRPLLLPGYDQMKMPHRNNSFEESLQLPMLSLSTGVDSPKVVAKEDKRSKNLNGSGLAGVFEVLLATKPLSKSAMEKINLNLSLSTPPCYDQENIFRVANSKYQKDSGLRTLVPATCQQRDRKSRENKQKNTRGDHNMKCVEDSRGKVFQELKLNNWPPRIRGRPSSSLIETLKHQTPYSRFQCSVCKRPFPRKKSLDAHMLVHNNIRPFSCDFPGCGKAFRQSGQLKTHKRLHTKERPFKCSVKGCKQTFTHANRHCWCHRDAPLVRINSNEDFDIDSVCSTLVQEHLNKLRNTKVTLPNLELLQKEIKLWLLKNIDNLGSEKQVATEDENDSDNDSVFTDEVDSPSSYDLNSAEQRRRMEGALALMELFNA